LKLDDLEVGLEALANKYGLMKLEEIVTRMKASKNL